MSSPLSRTGPQAGIRTDTVLSDGHFHLVPRPVPPPSGADWEVWGLRDEVEGNDWDESAVNYATAAGVDGTAPEGTVALRIEPSCSIRNSTRLSGPM